MTYFDLVDEYEKNVEVYDELFNATLPLMEMDNHVLKEALKVQIELMVQWEIMTKKFNYLYDECEIISDDEYGQALKAAMGDRYREVSISEAKEYAKTNSAYKNARRLMNKIRNSRDECRGLLEAVHSRKYIMNNMVQAIVAGVDSQIL